jgi:hypothetical protein
MPSITVNLTDAPASAAVTATLYTGATVVNGPVPATEGPVGVYTAELTAAAGSYVVQWRLADGEILASDSVTIGAAPDDVPEPPLTSWRPSVQNVADEITNYTAQAQGVPSGFNMSAEAGTFTVATGTTAEFVNRRISTAVNDVIMEVGQLVIDDHPVLWPLALTVTARRAALLVVMSKVGQRINNDNSDIIDFLKDEWTNGKRLLAKNAQDVLAENQPGSGDNRFEGSHTFNEVSAIGPEDPWGRSPGIRRHPDIPSPDCLPDCF